MLERTLLRSGRCRPFLASSATGPLSADTLAWPPLELTMLSANQVEPNLRRLV